MKNIEPPDLRSAIEITDSHVDDAVLISRMLTDIQTEYLDALEYSNDALLKKVTGEIKEAIPVIEAAANRMSLLSELYQELVKELLKKIEETKDD